MKRSTLLVAVFAAVFGITTAGVGASQYGGAQPEKQKPAAAAKSKPGKVHTMTGCLEKGEDNTFRLTSVEGTGPKTVELQAVASKNLAAHVGHKIAVTGPEVEPKPATTGTAGKPAPGAATSTTGAEHQMRVNSVKMISKTCS